MNISDNCKNKEEGCVFCWDIDCECVCHRTPQTQEEARQYAIDWQNWVSEQNLSYSELAYWQGVFLELGERFDLTEEFKENGII